MRQKLRQATLLATLSLLLLPLFSALMPMAASAAGAGSDIVVSLQTEVENRQKYYWLRNCFYHSDIDSVSSSEMASWDFFEGAGAGDMSEIIGAIYGANELATWGCKAEINVERAFKALGVEDPEQAFCKIDGAQYNNGSNYNSCINGSTPGAEWNNNLNSGDRQGDSFEKEAAVWAPDVVKSITDPQNYVRYYMSFMYECNVTIQSGIYKEGEADPDDAYRVPIITTGSDVIQYRLGIGIPTKDSQVAIVATKSGGVAYTGGDVQQGGFIQPPRGEVVTCDQAVERLRQYAPAYLDYLKKNPDALVTQLDELTSDGPAATCENKGGILSYILCPALGLLDSGIYLLTAGVESLLSVEEDKYNDKALVQAWGTMRNIALLILIPMMMLMVIGTALEFGPFDAYTVKKALPRMLLAVMFITLSLPITQFFVNLSNVVGYGIQNLVLATTDSPDSLLELYSVSGNLLFSSLVTGGLVVGAYVGVISIPIVGSLALVTFVALFMGYLTLVIRQLLILMLIIIAPLAILVWIFPGNDKLWKIWKTTFIALLMMFPLIMLLIASGKVFAGIIGSTESSFTAFFFKIIALIAPFFFIPATFKYGLGVFGNLAGMVNDRSRGLFDNQRKRRQADRAQRTERFGRKVLQKRGDIVRGLNKSASMDGVTRGRQRALRGAAYAIGGYNIEGQMSARTASVSKEVGDQIQTGVDGSVRGLSVDMAAADRSQIRRYNSQTGEWTGPSDENALKQVNSEGVTQYKSLGGAWIDESDVREGHARWGNDTFAQQAALSYEMRKAAKSSEVTGINDRWQSLAKEQYGMSDAQADGAWIGASFENQGQHLEFKNTAHSYKKDNAGNYGSGKLNAAKLASEAYEQKGTYQLSQGNAHTIARLGEAYDMDISGYAKKGQLDASGNVKPEFVDLLTQEQNETRAKIKATAENFMSRYGGGGGVTGMVDDTPLIQNQPGGGQNIQANSQGAAHVAQEVRKLAEKTGVLSPAPPTDIPELR